MKIECKVLGINRIDFTNDSGERINGYQIWIAGYTDAQNWSQGLEVMKSWIAVGSDREAIAQQLIPGDVVNVEFNRRGKPVITGVIH